MLFPRHNTRPAIFLVHVLLLLVTVAHRVQAAPVIDSDFGLDPDGATVFVRDYSCPCPQATVQWGLRQAGRQEGRGGLRISVTMPGRDGWNVQFKSKKAPLVPNTAYTACVWVRLSPDMLPTDGNATAVQSYMHVISTQNGVTFLSSLLITFSEEWKRVCIPDVQVDRQTTAYIAFDIGSRFASYDVAGVKLTGIALQQNFGDNREIEKRIEASRKGNLNIRFVAPNGRNINVQLNQARATLVRHDFAIGTCFDIMSWWDSSTKQFMLNTVADNFFNTVVPCSGFKWPYFEPSRGNYQGALQGLRSTIIKLAQDNDFVMTRGHAIEWYLGAYDDHWSRQDGCEQYKQYLRERIRRDMSNFKGQWNQYDLFNEVLHERQFIDQCNLWDDTLPEAFRWARAADPAAELCLNDYNLINGGVLNRADDMVELVNALKAKNAPVDCIGVQGYLSPGELLPSVYAMRINKLASTGLPLFISEAGFITEWSGGKPISSLTEEEQADEFEKWNRLWFSTPQVRGIVTWHFWDSDHWITNGGLWRADKTPKLAALRLKKLWGETYNTTVGPRNIKRRALFSWRGFYGKYQWSVVWRGKRYSGTVNFPASKGAKQTARIVLR